MSEPLQNPTPVEQPEVTGHREKTDEEVYQQVSRIGGMLIHRAGDLKAPEVSESYGPEAHTLTVGSPGVEAGDEPQLRMTYKRPGIDFKDKIDITLNKKVSDAAVLETKTQLGSYDLEKRRNEVKLRGSLVNAQGKANLSRQDTMHATAGMLSEMRGRIAKHEAAKSQNVDDILKAR